MTYDFKTQRWYYDIRSFERWKSMFLIIEKKEGLFYDTMRERLRGYMRDIQKRWPQYIKDHEIP